MKKTKNKISFGLEKKSFLRHQYLQLSAKKIWSRVIVLSKNFRF